jgi:cytochrome c-type biogenesis protein
MVETAVVGAVAFAASAGIATLFAPCAFQLLPGYVGYYLSEHEANPGMLAPAAAAAGGALAALTAVGLLVRVVGQPVKTALPVLEPVVGAGLLIFGIVTLLNRGPKLRAPLPERPASVTGFGVFGAAYAVAAAGCVVPFVFGVMTQALAFSLPSSVLVLAVYSLGVTLPLVGVTLLAGAGIDSWRAVGTNPRRVQQFAAVVMILAGGGQIYLAVFELGVL